MNLEPLGTGNRVSALSLRLQKQLSTGLAAY